MYRGRRSQGVVTRTELDGCRLLVAVSKGERLPEPRPGRPETLEPYKCVNTHCTLTLSSFSP